ncbi:MAG: hypothetical protein M1825_006069 [Sarcosagium campestre]|nr:MAG: hypothetical protein M1825_006069 [Sarcosagium campestre]
MLPSSDDYELRIRQGPERARVAGPKEKDRKPVDPPPIIQLRIKDDSDPSQNYLQSPYYFMCCNLYDVNAERPAAEAPNTGLAGTLVSSLHRLKDIDNNDGGFFVFGDLSVKIEGEFRLCFTLFEIMKADDPRAPAPPPDARQSDTPERAQVVHIKSVISDPFSVYAPKNFPGMSESTFLSRSFGDQGVRLRIRKEPRTLLKRPGPSGLRQEDYTRQYAAPMPQSSMGMQMHGQAPGQGMGGYLASPVRDYSPYGDAPKRQRTSIDTTPAEMYSREQIQAYEQKFLQQQQQQQQQTYAAYPQPSPGHYQMNFPSGSGTPQGLASEFSFRQSQASAASSPFESPGSQRAQRSPMVPSPGYQQQSGFFPQQQGQRQGSMQSMALQDPSPSPRHPQYAQSGNMSMVSPGLPRTPQGAGPYTPGGTPGGGDASMLPPHYGSQRGAPPQVQLPPLGSAGHFSAAAQAQTQTPPMPHTPSSSTSQRPYLPAPPSGFDPASQQTSQPPP